MLASLFALVAPPRCLACSAPVAAGVGMCGGCRAELAWMDARAAGGVWAPVAFDGPARALVHALKFAGRTAAAGVMAAQIAANAPPGLLGDGATVAMGGGPAAAPVLVPVPAHPARARARGFDQARLIARALARRTGLPVRDVLVRRGGGGRGPQVGAGRRERIGRDLGIAVRASCRDRDGAGGAPRGGLDGARIVLVDDVVTTGATLAACRRALLAAGAAEVAAVAYARTLA